MKFLIEKLIISEEDNQNYKYWNDKKKKKYIENLINSLPNKEYIKVYIDEFTDAVNEYGFDTNTNKMLDYFTKVNFRVPFAAIDVVRQLLEGGHAKSTDKWLYNESLYTEGPEEIIGKLKIVAYLNNPKNLQKYDVKFDPIFLMKSNGKDFLNYAQMSKKVEQLEARIESSERIKQKEKDMLAKADKDKKLQDLQSKQDKNRTVADYLRTIIKPFNAKNVREYVKQHTDFKTEQQMINIYIDNKELDSSIETVLNQKIHSSMGRTPQEVVSDLLQKYIYQGYRNAIQ